MNVGFVVLPYQHRSGAGNYYHKLAWYLSQTGLCRVTVFAPEESYHNAVRSFTDSKVVKLPIRSFPSSVRIAKSLLFDFDTLFRKHADIVHFFNVPVLRTSLPTVLTVYDLRDYDVPHLNTAKRNLAGRLLRAWSFNRCDRIVGISDFTLGSIARHFPRCASKSLRIYLGVDREFTRPDKSFEPPEKKPYVLAVGHLEPRKNLVRLVQAFCGYVEKTNDRETLLVLVGTPHDRHDTVVRKAVPLPFSHRIRFVGSVEQNELVRWYQGSRLFVFPSLYEGFGLPIVEAMACGIPVISSNAGSFPELLRDPEFMFPPEDIPEMTRKIELGLRDRAFRKRLMAHGKGIVDRFQWTNTASETHALYKRILHEKAT